MLDLEYLNCVYDSSNLDISENDTTEKLTKGNVFILVTQIDKQSQFF